MQEAKIDKLYQDIGSRIRDAREVNGITQDILASQLGLSRPSIINIEKGRHRASLHLIIEVAGFLQIDYTTLIPVESYSRPTNTKKPFDLKKAITDEKLSRSTAATIKQVISSI